MTLLKVENLTKFYKKTKAVNQVNFQFQSGKCIALIGPNGAGKTTILRMLAGLLKPTEGSIRFQQMNNDHDIREHIGYLPQYPSFHSWMTGKEFLVYSGKLSHLSAADANKRADELLDKVGIADAKNKRIGTYSGGMKQRLGIAQAIIHKPKLLILDEPVSALDPIGRRDVLTLMEQLIKDMTILFSTHILSDAEEISDELLLINHGEIVESGPMEELRAKYQTAAIELSFEDEIENYASKINHLSSVLSMSIHRNILQIAVSDIAEARKEILAIANQESWPITRFDIKRASLEDMFMKVVNS